MMASSFVDNFSYIPKRYVSDKNQASLTIGDKFRISSCSDDDGIPAYFLGRLGIITEINRIGKEIKYSFFDEPLQERGMAIESFRSHAEKYPG